MFLGVEMKIQKFWHYTPRQRNLYKLSIKCFSEEVNGKFLDRYLTPEKFLPLNDLNFCLKCITVDLLRVDMHRKLNKNYYCSR